MIGKLKGKVESCEENHAIIDVGGVGYSVFCSEKTLSKFNHGEYAELLIETHVREDHIHLYGFCNIEEKQTFNILQSVKGVGTRMALAVLSTLSPEEIQIALSAQDQNAFHQISGVGKKLAERIITELKDKLICANVNLSTEKSNPSFIKNNKANDAVLALVGLGISKSDAQIRINNILSMSPDSPISELIKLGLKKQ